MGRSSGGVGGYRGRRTITDILRFIAIALAVVVVLVLAGLFYLQRYVVYTDEGPKLELPPFLQLLRGGQDAKDPEPPGTGDISFTGGPSQSDPDELDGPEVPEEKDRAAGYALELTVGEVLDGTAAAKLEEAGAEALILEMKGHSGKLAWSSGQPNAERAKVDGPQAVNDALQQWNASEVYTIARVCCFRDDSLPYFRNPLALRRGSNNWRDELGLRWLSPAHEEAQAYIAALCGELAAMGFDEIVLEDFCFPVQGKLENINVGDSYDPARFTAEVESFLSQVEQAVAPYGTKISLRVGRDTLAGTETVSGVTAQILEQYAHRVWTERDGLLPAPLDLLEQRGIAGGEDRLVEITDLRTEDSAVVQAVLRPAG